MNRLVVALLSCLFLVSVPWACSSTSSPTNSNTCQVGLTSCASGCVATSTDALNCGACGHACGTGQQCSNGACQCLSGLTSCGAACVNLASDPANCNACGVACGAGMFCVSGGAGTSSCSASCPLTVCGASCVDTQSSVADCGACGKACAAGQSCSGGACACPSGQQLCNGACTSSPTCGGGNGGAGGGGSAGASGSNAGGASGATGASGTAGKAGASGSGGSGGATTDDPKPVDLNCTVNGASVKVAAADVISDFSQDTPLMYQTGTRGGTTWYAYGAEDAAGTPGNSTPGVGSNAFAIDKATSGPCNSGGSLKVSSPGNSGSTGWGVGFGVNLMSDAPGTMMKDKFDAKAAGYTGIGFFMKCQAETDFFYFKTVDAPNDADVQNPVCAYTGSGTICNQYGQKNTTNLTSWTYQKVYFSETLQDWDGGTVTAGIADNQLTAFQVQVNTQYTRDGSSRVANPFTCWIDDVHFIKSAPPSASVAPKACTSGTAAPGGYYVTGNKIMDCKTGQQKIFHGVARPSFEWDRAGWNITYDDLSRIAAMKANVVRYSLNQQFWLDPAKGALYQAYVDRAVKWTLSLGMDVILDLHWLTTAGQTNISDSTSPSFWKSVAQKYKGEGRVMFELFNEPHDIAAGDWKSAMQGMYNAVRSDAGANNLVFMGGLDWAYNLSQVLPGSAVTGTNIAYVTHPYDIKTSNTANTSAWDAAFGNLAATYPIIATEFGQANTTPGGAKSCDGSFYTTMLNYFKTKDIGWTGWAWFVDRGITDPSQTCGFPQLITSYSGTTNAGGTAIKAAF